MADLLGTGVSGLLAFQRSLATTSHNISNVNTEGYSRQRTELATRPPEYSGAGYVGSGVKVSSVDRIYNDFLNNQLVGSASTFHQLDTYHSFMSNINNLISDVDSGIAAGMQDLFGAMQDVANDPSSIPARQVLLGQSENLIDRTRYVQDVLENLREGVYREVETMTGEINSIASSIARINKDIVTISSAGTSGAPNDLLDQRDQLVRDLAQYTNVSTYEQDDGSLNVFIGAGQSLVVGFSTQQLGVQNDEFSPLHKDVVVSSAGVNVDISSQLRGGALGGAMDFISNGLEPTINELGRVMAGLVSTFNDQHALGMDLDGNLGGDFFAPLNSGSFFPQVLASSNNTGAASISVQYTDVDALTTSDYQLQYNGGSSYTLTRLSDKMQFNLDTTVPASLVNDGFQVNIGSAPNPGDTFLIKPTGNVVSQLRLDITDPRAVAAAVPVRTEASLNNTGSATIDAGVVVDRTAFVSDTYTVHMAADAGVTAGGGVGVINDDATTANTLEYRLVINGQTVHTQAEGDAPLADAAAVRDAINTQVALTGVRAYVDAGTLYLVNDPATAMPITVTESLVDTGGTALDAGDTVTGYFGSALTGGSASNSLTLAAGADSYLILDAAANVESSGAYVSGADVSFNGIQVAVSGAARLGDRFVVRANNSGVSDNRNALVLSALQDKKTLANGTASYFDAYGQLVANVGTATRTAEVTRDANAKILSQNVEARASISGVNLDEEAASLLKFQQAYQAAAQVISVADSLFKTLIGAVSR